VDVSPLYLLAPTVGFDEDENAFKVWLGGKVSHWPGEVRQWMRGVRPILGSQWYRSDEAASEGWRFYLLGSQPWSEWRRIQEAGKKADEIMGTALTFAPSEDADAV
jgi:hypothetical protein